MSAYLVGHISVNNETLWMEYLDGVGKSLAPFDANVLFRGKLKSVLAGRHDHELVVVIAFSDATTLSDWYHSETYQSLIPLRDKAADVVLATYEA